MANFDTDLVRKNIRHRGRTTGKVDSVSGALRVKAGGSIATTDLMRMVPMGENTRPIRITAQVKEISGTPVLTNPSFSVGISPVSASNFTRADGVVFSPVTASGTRLGASTALTTDEMAQFTEIDTVADVQNWAPYFITLTPSGAGAFSVAGGDVDVILTVEFVGEHQAAEPVYTSFLPNGGKYKN
jgi:hypothetical protein